MQKVIFGFVNMKIKLGKVSQIKEENKDELKSFMEIENWMEEIKYLTND